MDRSSGSGVKGKSNRNEKMRRVFLSGVCVYVCFNCYARNVPDSKVFHRMIVSVFSRMNQIHFVFRGESGLRPCRRPCRAERRAPGTLFAEGKGRLSACRNLRFVSGNVRTTGHATRRASQV
ncbi:hypothetical protein BCEN4_2110008 [Burkholderia cenocepacia]|nr:hypothetical protein BCEN4_2110008 [Burkholderia cenocepacia]